MKYELYDGPGLQGRGEFARLALEDAGADYTDIALVPEDCGGGVPALMEYLESEDIERPPFAPKFLGYFERVLERNTAGGPGMVGKRIIYADLSMAQVIAGLRYAFPKASRKALRKVPRLVALHDRIFARARIRRYVASNRRVPFNNEGLFRRYKELDT